MRRLVSTRQHELALAAVLLLAIFLRTQQLLSQVLIDDEWHAIHRILVADYQQIFLSFGHSDYSIPVTLYYRFIADHVGLSEWGMRWPFLVVGLVTVFLGARYISHQAGPHVGLVFALLLAISPLLVNYSRIARPYALSLLCSMLALVAFLKWTQEENTSSPRAYQWAGTYTFTAVLGTWLHPMVGPLVVAPFLWQAWQLGRGWVQARTIRLRDTLPSLLLGSLTALLMCAVILPPLLADPSAMKVKSGFEIPLPATYLGAWYLWLGTGNHLVVAFLSALSLLGVRAAYQQFKQLHQFIFIGTLLCLLVIYLTKPMASANPLVLARYLLFLCPLFLLWVAFGIVRLSKGLAQYQAWGMMGLGGAIAVLTFTGPLKHALRYPNNYQAHSVYQFDWRKGKNVANLITDQFAVSPFWSRLATQAPGSVIIAAGPYAFESFHNMFHEWQRRSRQIVLPVRLQGYCMPVFGGESIDARFPFRNQLQADDLATLQKQSVDWLAIAKPQALFWIKPYQSSLPVDQCLKYFDARLGLRAFEDESVVIYKVPKL